MVLLLSFHCLCFATLPDFTLTVTKTDESCLGNGTLTFNATGTQPGATVEYKIYQLPDTTSPIAVQTTNFLGGRTAGTYLVVATQHLGGDTSSQSQEITINNIIVPLTYTITSTHSLCGPDAAITVTVDSGVGAFYEILSGPVIRGPQASNVFNAIPAGVYEVRVIDNCGVGWVVTHTVVSDSANLTIGQTEFPVHELPDCDHIIVSNTLTASQGHSIAYPLNMQYTIHPPGGGSPIIIPKIVTTGGVASQEVQTVLPLYYGQQYFYDLQVTDNCGNTYNLPNNLVDATLTVFIIGEQAVCGQKFLSVHASFYVLPIQVNWISAPAGFDPVAFNPTHPGPFNDGVMEYGDYDHPVPWGTYVVEITDACGRTAQNEITLEYEEPDPTADIVPYPGCQSNMSKVTIQIPGFTIVSAVITAAPAAYPNALPHDVSAFITLDEGLILEYLITGDYTVHLIDDCGNKYDYDFHVPDTATSTTSLSRPDCELGKGGIRIRGGSGNIITSAIMTAGPAAYSSTYPIDVTSYITTSLPAGTLSMGALPAGQYSFTVTDNCGLTHVETVNVVGYAISLNNFTLTPHCGSFDFTLNYTSTAAGGETFWLQKFNPATSTWGHPVTGVPYVDGTSPNATDSYIISNNSTTLNLTFTGQFRIIKRFQAFEDGNVGEFKECIEVIDEFEFTGIFEITGFVKVTCNGAFADIKVLTNGVPPLTYKIIKKNGFPFVIDNGSNNIFTNLEQAIYTFEVQHACGHIATGDADVAQLPSLAAANQPPNLEACDDSSQNGQETFDLSAQDAIILGSQNPADFVLTYHSSLADATTGNNPLPDNYTSGNHTIYARLKYTASAADCFDVTSFDLVVKPYPVPDMQAVWPMCQGSTVTVTAPLGFDDYIWSTGQHGVRSVVLSQSGQYSVTVVDGDCEGVFAFEVTESNAAVIEHIDIDDWTSADNSISVILDAASLGDYVYSIDGVHYQDSPVFNNLPAGGYTVYVKDLGDCGIVTENVFLLTYPKFFTPNGDSHNDYWRIRFSEVEPHLMTYVFDRYGKLITGFLPNSPGWDGTYNGEPLPSTDYWFLVIREDGKEFRGHFAMKR